MKGCKKIGKFGFGSSEWSGPPPEGLMRTAIRKQPTALNCGKDVFGH